jgi:hypothetical protein
MDDEWFALNVPLARKLAQGCSEKTTKLLKLIVAGNGKAQVSVALQELGYEKWQDLRGIQAGLNRRIRNITGLSEIYILDWDEDDKSYDKNGNYIDGRIAMRPESVAALKRVFDE